MPPLPNDSGKGCNTPEGRPRAIGWVASLSDGSGLQPVKAQPPIRHSRGIMGGRDLRNALGFSYIRQRGPAVVAKEKDYTIALAFSLSLCILSTQRLPVQTDQKGTETPQNPPGMIQS